MDSRPVVTAAGCVSEVVIKRQMQHQSRYGWSRRGRGQHRNNNVGAVGHAVYVGNSDGVSSGIARGERWDSVGGVGGVGNRNTAFVPLVRKRHRPNGSNRQRSWKRHKVGARFGRKHDGRRKAGTVSRRVMRLNLVRREGIIINGDLVNGSGEKPVVIGIVTQMLGPDADWIAGGAQPYRPRSARTSRWLAIHIDADGGIRIVIHPDNMLPVPVRANSGIGLVNGIIPAAREDSVVTGNHVH